MKRSPAHAVGPYRRVMLKISGESLADENGEALGVQQLASVADQVAELARAGVECSIVVGGGNFFRAQDADRYAVSRAVGDELGMLATAMNATMLEGQLQERGVDVQYFGSGPAAGRGQRWSPRRARTELDRGKVVVIAGGLGVGGVSTDVPAVKFAADVQADVVLMSKHGVDGVYSVDPKRDPHKARFLAEISTSDALRQDLRFADRLAIEMAHKYGVPLRVIAAGEPGTIVRAGLGHPIGSLVEPDVKARRQVSPRPILLGFRWSGRPRRFVG